MIEKIKKEIKTAFEKINQNREINLNKIRVKININHETNKLNYEIYDGTTFHSSTKLSELISSIYAIMAEGKLKDAVEKYTTITHPNAILFLKNGEIEVYLCNDAWSGHAIKLEDLFE